MSSTGLNARKFVMILPHRHADNITFPRIACDGCAPHGVNDADIEADIEAEQHVSCINGQGVGT